jgi:hypothetical protein
MSGESPFMGPIFIVGMPRSGTKLLRDLLNNHSRIAIAPNESHFIPDFHNRIERYGALQDRSNFSSFYRDFSQTIFFERVTAGNPFINEQSWHDCVKDWTYAGVVEAFYLAYAHSKGKLIWGDKTPYYLAVIPLLKSLFPRAKFVHIVRDVRDYCLSLNKGWNKNIYRSAQRWYDVVRKGRRDGRDLPLGDFHEVQYEQLVDAPGDVLRGICGFLSLPYEAAMTNLQRPVDHGGDASNRLDILKRNYGKWKTALSPRQIMKIESLCGDLLGDLGYSVSYRGNMQRLGAVEMQFYKAFDAVSLLRFEIRENGMANGLRNVVRAIRYSQFRAATEED